LASGVLIRFAARSASLNSDVSRRLGRNDPCHCGSGKKYKRCCLDSDRTRKHESDLPPQQIEPTQAYTLFVETAAGALVRHVPDASPLQSGIRAGPAAELATRDAAAYWGLPDFVFQAELYQLGSGSRELGDGIVVVGDVGLVVQVKCRESEIGNDAKEWRWTEKKVRQALSQANGSIRFLRRTPSTKLTSRRGCSVVIDGSSIRWIPVVVLDHPQLPATQGFTPDLDGANRAVVLLRRDWEFLFDQLKSTAAVVGYLDRVAGEPIPLGNEPVRYYEYARADEQATPSPRNTRLFGGRGRQSSLPLLPMEPADATAHRMVRLILEDIAVAGLKQAAEENRLRVLAELDRIPVAHREETGRFLLQALEQVSGAEPDETMWSLRRTMGPSESVLLGFGACSSAMDEVIRAAFEAWARLRHFEAQQETDNIEDLTTIAVLITPRYDGKRQWDTTVVALGGDLRLTSEDLELFEETWRRTEDIAINPPDK
jgi:hypothetical protein